MITIPQSVADTITEIKQEEECHHLHLDRWHAQAHAYARERYDAVDWIYWHDADYGQAVLHGYIVRDDTSRVEENTNGQSSTRQSRD